MILQAAYTICRTFLCWQLELATKTCTNVFGSVELPLTVFPGRTDCAVSALHFWFADVNVREEFKRHPENSKIF